MLELILYLIERSCFRFEILIEASLDWERSILLWDLVLKFCLLSSSLNPGRSALLVFNFKTDIHDVSTFSLGVLTSWSWFSSLNRG